MIRPSYIAIILLTLSAALFVAYRVTRHSTMGPRIQTEITLNSLRRAVEALPVEECGRVEASGVLSSKAVNRFVTSMIRERSMIGPPVMIVNGMILDGWGQPLSMAIVAESDLSALARLDQHWLGAYSLGKNGKDEKGVGDDVRLAAPKPK